MEPTLITIVGLPSVLQGSHKTEDEYSIEEVSRSEYVTLPL